MLTERMFKNYDGAMVLQDCINQGLLKEEQFRSLIIQLQNDTFFDD